MLQAYHMHNGHEEQADADWKLFPGQPTRCCCCSDYERVSPAARSRPPLRALDVHHRLDSGRSFLLATDERDAVRFWRRGATCELTRAASRKVVRRNDAMRLKFDLRARVVPNARLPHAMASNPRPAEQLSRHYLHCSIDKVLHSYAKRRYTFTAHHSLGHTWAQSWKWWECYMLQKIWLEECNLRRKGRLREKSRWRYW